MRLMGDRLCLRFLVILYRTCEFSAAVYQNAIPLSFNLTVFLAHSDVYFKAFLSFVGNRECVTPDCL